MDRRSQSSLVKALFRYVHSYICDAVMYARHLLPCLTFCSLVLLSSAGSLGSHPSLTCAYFMAKLQDIEDSVMTEPVGKSVCC